MCNTTVTHWHSVHFCHIVPFLIRIQFIWDLKRWRCKRQNYSRQGRKTTNNKKKRQRASVQDLPPCHDLSLSGGLSDFWRVVNTNLLNLDNSFVNGKHSQHPSCSMLTECCKQVSCQSHGLQGKQGGAAACSRFSLSLSLSPSSPSLQSPNCSSYQPNPEHSDVKELIQTQAFPQPGCSPLCRSSAPVWGSRTLCQESPH